MAGIDSPLDFPVYIPTRGRPQKQLTADALLKLGISPYLVVEAAEEQAYREANPDCKVIVWPQEYLDNYEKTPELDPHPTTGAAHNYAWDHSRANGYTHHWIMDDNIRGFLVRSKGKRANVANALALHWHEDFIRKYQNLAGVALAMAPFMRGSAIALNTRLYCCTLYRNDLDQYGIKWRRGLNDDTIVSLDILKTGYWCTAESRVAGIIKMGTSRKGRLEGGMTDFYAQGGFIKKSAELVRTHPDCSKTVVKFNRVHHVVDFSKFKQQLIPVDQSKVLAVQKKSESVETSKKVPKVSESLQTGMDLADKLVQNPDTKVMYPIYIPSKNRADSGTTAKLFQKAGVPFYVLVEPQDADKYRKYYKEEELVVMDENDKGIDYARNFAKNHSKTLGAKFHWQFDDDVKAFRFRIGKQNVKTDAAQVINLAESVTDLYTNVGASSLMYDTWAFNATSPIKLNKMMASAMLFNNENDFKFEPHMVEDIDISMQYLSAGYVTLLFATALVTVPTTLNDKGGLGVDARLGEERKLRCENLVKKWGDDFKVITKNGALRIAPSRVWGKFPQQPILKSSNE